VGHSVASETAVGEVVGVSVGKGVVMSVGVGVVDTAVPVGCGGVLVGEGKGVEGGAIVAVSLAGGGTAVSMGKGVAVSVGVTEAVGLPMPGVG